MSFPCHGFLITSAAQLLICNDIGTDYDSWPDPTMCQIKSHGIQGLIHGTYKTLKENGDSKKKAEKTTLKCKRSDALVTGRISVSLTKYVMTADVGPQTVSLSASVVNELVVGTEEWMKKTAESYTIRDRCCGILVFAAAIM